MSVCAGFVVCVCVSVGILCVVSICVCVRASFVHNNNYNLTSDFFRE